MAVIIALMRGDPSYFSTQVMEARRFYLELGGRRSGNAAGAGAARVASGGYELCSPEYDIQRQTFPFLTIELVAKGSGTVLLNGELHRLVPGSVFIYNPAVPHRITADPRQGMAKYFIAITGEEGYDWLEEAGLPRCGFLQVRPLAELVHLYEVLAGHGRGDREDRTRLCTITLQYLISRLGSLATPGEAENPAENPVALATYRRCRQFIEEHFLTIHSLAEIATACHIDPAYLCRLFRRFRRQSPFAYLQALKMNRAVDLLQHGDTSVKAVAARLGYPDPYNFSRAFKRVYGLSPGKILPHPRR